MTWYNNVTWLHYVDLASGGQREWGIRKEERRWRNTVVAVMASSSFLRCSLDEGLRESKSSWSLILLSSISSFSRSFSSVCAQLSHSEEKSHTHRYKITQDKIINDEAQWIVMLPSHCSSVFVSWSSREFLHTIWRNKTYCEIFTQLIISTLSCNIHIKTTHYTLQIYRRQTQLGISHKKEREFLFHIEDIQILFYIYYKK